MIEKIRIFGYRKFRDTSILPHGRFNIIVGENEAGKSTLLEAVGLATTGRINGRPAWEELNPFWFNTEVVNEFFANRLSNPSLPAPTISIEVYFSDTDALKKRFHGAHNCEKRACCGISFKVQPDPSSTTELDSFFQQSSAAILPVEYYQTVWRAFSDESLSSRPSEVGVATIDGRTLRSTNGVDFHLRQILQDHLDASEKAEISVAYRSAMLQVTQTHLNKVNQKLEQIETSYGDKKLSLAMDQSARGTWDTNVVPHVTGIPFSMSGQGTQAVTKISLAMSRTTAKQRIVLVEEPETHLSHSRLNRLLVTMEDLAKDDQQLFITTHSSFVMNRLGLDGLVLMSNGEAASFTGIADDTVEYFRKLAGYDTLRIALADKSVLVEGPSDEIVFERFYKDLHGGRRPIDDGIDVVCARGLSFARYLELAKCLNKKCAVVRDNDGKDPAAIEARLRPFLEDQRRQLFVGAATGGMTLEPQIVSANTEDSVRKVLGLADGEDLAGWMSTHKTESAIRILDSEGQLNPPRYIADAITFIQ